MSTQLQGKTVAFAVATEGVEQVELTEPWAAVQQAGATPKLISCAPMTKLSRSSGRSSMRPSPSRSSVTARGRWWKPTFFEGAR